MLNNINDTFTKLKPNQLLALSVIATLVGNMIQVIYTKEYNNWSNILLMIFGEIFFCLLFWTIVKDKLRILIICFAMLSVLSIINFEIAIVSMMILMITRISKNIDNSFQDKSCNILMLIIVAITILSTPYLYQITQNYWIVIIVDILFLAKYMAFTRYIKLVNKLS